jgi:hypothetical protein
VHTLHYTIKKFPVFHEIQKFIAILITFSHLTLSLHAPTQPHRQHFPQSIPRAIAVIRRNMCSSSLGSFLHPAGHHLSLLFSHALKLCSFFYAGLLVI